MQLNHPKILEFGYIHRTMYFNQGLLALEATAEQIRKTVPKDHPELPLLRESYAIRRAEIREAAAKKNDELRKQAADKETEEERLLVSRGSDRDENVRRFSKK